jgi:hypothetical protein
MTMRLFVPFVIVALALGALASCSESGERASAGSGAEQRFIDSVPLARFPSDPEQSLFQVLSGALSGNSVFIAESSTPTIHRFALDGAELGTMGAKGRGPGEFEYLNWVGFRDSLIVAYDGATRRVSYFSRAGTHIRDVALPVRESYAITSPVGQFADGTLMLRAITKAAMQQFGAFRSQTTLFRLSSDGTRLDSISVFDDNEVVRTAMANGGWRQSARPFGRMSIAFAFADSAYVVDNNDRGVQMISQGRVSRVYPDERRDSIVATADDLRRERQVYTRGDDPQGSAGKAFDAMLVPRVLPAYGWGLETWEPPAALTTGGELWLTQYESARTGSPRWTVMDLATRTSRVVRANRGIRILDANDTLALVLLRDPDGVESVELRRIRRE